MEEVKPNNFRFLRKTLLIPAPCLLERGTENGRCRGGVARGPRCSARVFSQVVKSSAREDPARQTW